MVLIAFGIPDARWFKSEFHATLKRLQHAKSLLQGILSNRTTTEMRRLLTDWGLGCIILEPYKTLFFAVNLFR